MKGIKLLLSIGVLSFLFLWYGNREWKHGYKYGKKIGKTELLLEEGYPLKEIPSRITTEDHNF